MLTFVVVFLVVVFLVFCFSCFFFFVSSSLRRLDPLSFLVGWVAGKYLLERMARCMERDHQPVDQLDHSFLLSSHHMQPQIYQTRAAAAAAAAAAAQQRSVCVLFFDLRRPTCMSG